MTKAEIVEGLRGIRDAIASLPNYDGFGKTPQTQAAIASDIATVDAAIAALSAEEPAADGWLPIEIERLREALDHIARVALGSRKMTKRTAWIVDRAKSALGGDEAWQTAEKPKGYHDALHLTPNA